MSAQSLVAQGYGGYAGWGDAEADADFRATGGSGKRDVSASQAAGYSPTLTQQDIYAQQAKLQEQAIQPSVEVLTASKPSIEAAYSQREAQLLGTKPSLNAKYDQLISELTRKETIDVETIGKTMATEWSNRGIPLSSDIYSQALNKATQNATQYYSGQETSVNLERNSKIAEIDSQLASLPIEKSKELNQIDFQIGELKRTGAQAAIVAAYQSYRDSVADKWQQAQNDLETSKLALQKYQAETPTYQATSLNDKLYSFNPQTGEYSPSSINSLKNQLGGNLTTTTPEKKPLTAAQQKAYAAFGILPQSWIGD